MQMIFDQHPSAFRQSTCAICFEIGTKLRTDFVRTVPGGSQAFSYAIRSGPHDLRIRRGVTDRIHQTIEILVGH